MKPLDHRGPVDLGRNVTGVVEVIILHTVVFRKVLYVIIVRIMGIWQEYARKEKASQEEANHLGEPQLHHEHNGLSKDLRLIIQ